MEYNKECALKWKSNSTQWSLFAGDQENIHDLKTMILEFGSNFDFIIDDGGHTMKQQVTSFSYLFPHVKKGGLYFIEDMGTSYLSEYDGGFKKNGTAIEMTKYILDSINGHGNTEIFGNIKPIVHMIKSFYCFKTELCIFQKL